MLKAFAFGTDPWDPSNRFETSWLLSPWVLFGLRALMTLYAFTTLLLNIGYQCAHEELGGCQASRDGFSYFTSLAYWGLAFYLLTATVHTFSYARYGHPLLSTLPRPLQALHALFYSSVTSFPFLVTIVYWGLLYPYGRAWFPSAWLGWSNVSEHGLNSLFALLEVLVPRTAPQPWVHALWLVVLLALYLALAYVTRATKGFYTYEFLDPTATGSLVAAYVFGIGAAVVIIFAIVRGLVWVRCWVTEDKLGLRGKFAAPVARAGDVEEHDLGSRDVSASK
ncbi:hypothetical protein GGR54DRAFT_610945 [Hypoxylon sp. NC1633]|nr:hypothetical protein GGR54DRAFT_610945 [Hypoxylon sp. NC1633]